MIPTNIKRPRNVDVSRAAAILYGDWGTSKAYVIGLAFAVAGYASFWLIAAMCILTALVGINYMVICRLYPDGGGVYASVRHRSEVISIVGAFLLIADYLVTAAISALSAFQYLGVPHPEKFAAGAILIIGLLNLLGPKQTGGLAFLVSLPTALVVIILGLFSLPHLGQAFAHLQPLHGTFSQNWAGFVGIVLALSGVEAIANATGVMKLDPGSTEQRPSVVKTSTPAILMVMIEVCVFTALLGLAMHALSGLQIVNGDVNAPGAEGVRDYMLRYMGQVFVGGALGPALGHAFGFVVSIVFAMLLLSAVNTAIVDLIMIQFLMSRDREVPAIFHRLNKWGVPSAGMVLATLVPMALVLLVKDMAGLADLYAVGVVGAIATNLGATATDRKLSIKSWERTLMFTTFVVMAAIEMSLLIDKPNARYFAVTILAVGLILRGLVMERRMKKEAVPAKVPLEMAAANFRQFQVRKTLIDRRVNSVRNPRHRAYARFRIARSARDRQTTVSALRARTAVHDRAGRETQMAGRSRGQHDFWRSETKSPGSSSSVLLCCQSISGGNDCRCCRDGRRVTRYSRRTSTKRVDKSPSRERHSRSFPFIARRH